MTPRVVVDVGNSRIKWGLCQADRVSAMTSLPLDDRGAWDQQASAWGLSGPCVWVVAGVHPKRRDEFGDWIRQRHQEVVVLDDWRTLGLEVRLAHPAKVGIDRLLNAAALRCRTPPSLPAVIAGVGSAVTVDWVDATGAFRGGAIFPGMRLMAEALHAYTALLPLILVPTEVPPFPGTSTPAAMSAGIYWATVGGIAALWQQLRATNKSQTWHLFLTGGDAPLIARALPGEPVLWPEMTLEGMRLAAGNIG